MGSGLAGWRGVDLVGRGDWVHELSPAEIDELRSAVRVVRARASPSMVCGGNTCRCRSCRA